MNAAGNENIAIGYQALYNNLVIDTPQPPIITIHDNNVEVGRIDIVDGTLKFTGKADEAAKMFFEHTLKNMCDNYINGKLRQFNEDVERRVKEELSKYDNYRIKITYKENNMVNV